MGELLKLIGQLDAHFTEKTLTEIEEAIKNMQIKNLDFVIDRLHQQEDGKVHISKGTKFVEATSMVYLDCEYMGDQCIAKVMHADIDKLELFVESIINIFMSAVINDRFNTFISSPDILTMGKVNRKPFEKGKSDNYMLVQQKIGGIEFKYITEGRTLSRALETLCKGLDILQKDYNFAHRDFHGGNVMYDESKNKVYIIDFGFSCFSIPQTEGSVQGVETGFGYNPFNEEYRAHRKCDNKSHDLCILILSLQWMIHKPEWLDNLGKEISKKYKDAMANKTLTDEFFYQDKKIRTESPDFAFDKEIIHYWYLYEMFDIDIGMGPTKLLQYLETNTNYKPKQVRRNRPETPRNSRFGKRRWKF